MCRCSARALVAVLVAIQVIYLFFSLSVYDSRVGYHSGTTPAPVDVTVDYDNETADLFLSTYDEYCQQSLIPKPTNLIYGYIARNLCPCIPDDLVGRLNMSAALDPPMIGELELQHIELSPGGSWSPSDCTPRHRIAVIVPFRDREEHLRSFLSLIHPMLQRQRLHYTVYVVEQSAPAVFNKASLMNAGFIVARSQADFDCFIFHDVDMLPEDDRNFYTCSDVPRHVGSHLNKWEYKVPYEGIFGGATAFRRQHFELVNGFSNQYYGWGGEDDDMYNRIQAKNLSITRFSRAVARYTMIKHESDVGNPSSPIRYHGFKLRPKWYPFDGLNTLRYKLVAIEARPLYIWLHIALPPHPAFFRGSYRAPPPTSASVPSIVGMSAVVVTTLSVISSYLSISSVR